MGVPATRRLKPVLFGTGYEDSDTCPPSVSVRRWRITANSDERRHRMRLTQVTARSTWIKFPRTEHSTRWGGGSNCCSDETSTRHSGVSRTSLPLSHRSTGSSGISSYLSEEGREGTRNPLAPSTVADRTHTKCTLLSMDVSTSDSDRSQKGNRFSPRPTPTH